MPTGLVTVDVDGNDSIELIDIIPQSNPPLTSSQLNISLTVQPEAGTSGSIPYLGSIQRTGTNGELSVFLVNVQGTIGNSASPHSTSIVAQSIGSITAAGDIASDITATGSSLPSTQFPGTVSAVTSTTGQILGNISAVNANIIAVSAGGNIGATGSTVQVQAKTGIRSVQATSMVANIFLQTSEETAILDDL